MAATIRSGDVADYRTATTISTERLMLTLLRVEDADEMALVLGDRRLHELIGGHPATLGELRDRCGRLVVGARSPGGVWLNWIVRVRPEGTAVGTVQATITGGVTPMAAVAWVIGVAWQGRGWQPKRPEPSSDGCKVTVSKRSPPISTPITWRRWRSPPGRPTTHGPVA
jgi:hypothetical protein